MQKVLFKSGNQINFDNQLIDTTILTVIIYLNFIKHKEVL